MSYEEDFAEDNYPREDEPDDADDGDGNARKSLPP
mgnify:CR=1 FL=1